MFCFHKMYISFQKNQIYDFDEKNEPKISWSLYTDIIIAPRKVKLS